MNWNIVIGHKMLEVIKVEIDAVLMFLGGGRRELEV